jgi:SAM-dependent methyltransferase
MGAMTLAEYYRRRAADYDAFYADPVRQADLTTLREWLAAQTRGRHVLEVAAGTGYWTAVAAATAATVTATDINAEMLEIARGKMLGAHVRLLRADLWDLPDLSARFDLGMAHLWWSHLRKHERAGFLTCLAARLEPGATLLMIDERLVTNVGMPIRRTDEAGNSYQRRFLAGQGQYEIVKNYPDAAELENSLGATCDRIRVLELTHFWALSARFIPPRQ